MAAPAFIIKNGKHVFYPNGLAQSKWFQFYCQHFNTLELNVTFYRFPTETTLSKWYKASPPDFKFSVKVPKAITHYKKLNDCERMLNDFYKTSQAGLHEKLGGILFQFPPQLIYSSDRLKKIISNVNPGFKNVVEFRHASWWNKDVIRQLKKNNIIFCGISYPGLPDKVVKTNPSLYYRLHGVPVLYKSVYQRRIFKTTA